MSLFRTLKCFMSTFRISYFPHFFHRLSAVKCIDSNNLGLSSNNLGLLREKVRLLCEKGGSNFYSFFKKKVAEMFGSFEYFL